MKRIRAFVIDIHRRSLWQVLAVYLATSWFVLQVAEHVVERFLLPEWVYGAAVLLLLIGLPIVLATALVREQPAETAGPTERSGAGGRSFGPDHEQGPASLEAPQPARGAGRTLEASGPGALGEVKRRLASGPLRFLTWPRAVAGGLVAFSGLALVGSFFYLQGVPRITEARGEAGDAFQERSWILVSDFAAADPDDRGVALAVREALTVDLQQSEHVNVMASSQVAGVLRRMDASGGMTLDVPLALEVAERFGAGAVLTATVSRLGPQYVVSGRALVAGSGEELFAVRVAAAEARLLEGVESLSREVRRRLGEARGMIRESRPLPDVTTRSLEALKAYAEAERALSVGDHQQVLVLADEAERLDPSFAMAHRLAAVAAFNVGRAGEGRIHAARAYEFRDRLSDRERLQVEAFYHLLAALDPRAAIELYELVLGRYPDDFRATNNLGTALSTWMSDFEAAARWFERARDLDPNSVLVPENLIYTYGVQGRFDDVEGLIIQLENLGAAGAALRFRVRERFARGDFDQALEICEAIRAGPAQLVQATDDRELCGSVHASLGRFDLARAELEDAIQSYLARGQHVSASQAAFALALMARVQGDHGSTIRRLEAHVDELVPDELQEPDRYVVRTNLQVVALLLGADALAAEVGERIPPFPEPDHWLRRHGASLVEAAEAVAAGRGSEALEQLRTAEAEGYAPVGWFLARRWIRVHSHRAEGDVESEARQLRELVEPGLAAFGKGAPVLALLPELLVRLGELEEERGAPAAAEHYRRFLDLWSDADASLAGRVREVEEALVRLEDGVDAG